MRLLDSRLLLTTLLLEMTVFFSCSQPLKYNEFTIYISKDDTGWHFVELKHDTIQTGYQKIEVKFASGQKFQTAMIRFNVDSSRPIFLYNTGDTIKSELWFVGTYNYDPIPKTFISFYVPTEKQQKTIKNYMKDPCYDSLREEMDNLVQNYLRKQNDLK